MTDRTDPALAALDHLRTLEDAIPPVEIEELWAAQEAFARAVPTSPAGLRAKLEDIESVLRMVDEGAGTLTSTAALIEEIQTIKQGLPLLRAV